MTCDSEIRVLLNPKISTLNPFCICCSFAEGTPADDIIMTCGSEIGALLVDGLGDGILIACPSQDLSFLRNMSFNILQGARMRNTKTGVSRRGAQQYAVSNPSDIWQQLWISNFCLPVEVCTISWQDSHSTTTISCCVVLSILPWYLHKPCRIESFRASSAFWLFAY